MGMYFRAKDLRKNNFRNTVEPKILLSARAAEAGA